MLGLLISHRDSEFPYGYQVESVEGAQHLLCVASSLKGCNWSWSWVQLAKITVANMM